MTRRGRSAANAASGCQPTASAASSTASSQSGIPNANWLSFNINYKVKVKLTEAGVDALRADHQRYADFLPEVFDKPFEPPKTDEEGYATFQLWQVLQTFGQQITMGAKLPFETTILLDASAMSAFGQDAKRLEAKPASAAPERGDAR